LVYSWRIQRILAHRDANITQRGTIPLKQHDSRPPSQINKPPSGNGHGHGHFQHTTGHTGGTNTPNGFGGKDSPHRLTAPVAGTIIVVPPVSPLGISPMTGDTLAVPPLASAGGRAVSQVPLDMAVVIEDEAGLAVSLRAATLTTSTGGLTNGGSGNGNEGVERVLSNSLTTDRLLINTGGSSSSPSSTAHIVTVPTTLRSPTDDLRQHHVANSNSSTVTPTAAAAVPIGVTTATSHIDDGIDTPPQIEGIIHVESLSSEKLATLVSAGSNATASSAIIASVAALPAGSIGSSVPPTTATVPDADPPVATTAVLPSSASSSPRIIVGNGGGTAPSSPQPLPSSSSSSSRVNISRRLTIAARGSGTTVMASAAAAAVINNTNTTNPNIVSAATTVAIAGAATTTGGNGSGSPINSAPSTARPPTLSPSNSLETLAMSRIIAAASSHPSNRRGTLPIGTLPPSSSAAGAVNTKSPSMMTSTLAPTTASPSQGYHTLASPNTTTVPVSPLGINALLINHHLPLNNIPAPGSPILMNTTPRPGTSNGPPTGGHSPHAFIAPPGSGHGRPSSQLPPPPGSAAGLPLPPGSSGQAGGGSGWRALWKQQSKEAASIIRFALLDSVACLVLVIVLVYWAINLSTLKAQSTVGLYLTVRYLGAIWASLLVHFHFFTYHFHHRWCH
jgi:hypothetical protein